MSRRYADPITVTMAVPLAAQQSASKTVGRQPGPALGTGDPFPAGFRWRWRRYRVLAVHARWIEAGPWWRAAVPGRQLAGRRDARDADAGRAGNGLRDRVVWRVEASCGDAPPGVYDLCQIPGPPDTVPLATTPTAPTPTSAAPDRWLLVRALD